MHTDPFTSRRLESAATDLAIGSDGGGCWAAYRDGPRVPLLALEVYDRSQLRADRLDRLTVDRLERSGDSVHVTVSDRGRGVVVGAWVRPTADGGFAVTVSPAEVYECRPDLYRLFAIDVLPGLMRCGADGTLLLPVNTGVLCRPAGKPPLADRFLIYGEQARWELLPTLPTCAAQTPAGGLVALASQAAAEAECRVSTDGQGNGTVGLSFHWRSHDVSPVEQGVREVRYSPVPAGADLTVFTAGIVRRHVTDELGKPSLERRAAESPEVAHLLGATILKLFYGVQAQGQMLGDAGGDTGGNVPRFLLTMTFDEAAAGMDQLRAAGVDRMYAQNVGWNFRGHDGAYPTRFPVEERVGGEAAFRKLIADRHAAGDAMTVHDNYVDAYSISADFDPDVVTVDPYGQMQLRGFWGGGPSYLQWPLAMTDRHLAGPMRQVKELGVRGPYYLDGMGCPLYANHHPRHRGPRSDLARGVDRLLRTARDLFGSSATETGFLYCSLTPDLVANPGGHDLVKLCKPEWPGDRPAGPDRSAVATGDERPGRDREPGPDLGRHDAGGAAEPAPPVRVGDPPRRAAGPGRPHGRQDRRAAPTADQTVRPPAAPANGRLPVRPGHGGRTHRLRGRHPRLGRSVRRRAGRQRRADRPPGRVRRPSRQRDGPRQPGGRRRLIPRGSRMQKVRIGFVGVGGMGQAAHLTNYVTLDDAEVVALAEARPELARRVAARYGVPRVYPNHRELLASEPLDAIVAIQQFGTHAEIVPELLAKGVPVLTEKPLADTVEHAAALVDAVARTGTPLYLGYHKRSDPATAYAVDQIRAWRASGEVGAMRYVRVAMPPGDWVANGFAHRIDTNEAYAPDYGMGTPFGAFVNYYVHQVNLIRFLADDDYNVTYADPGRVLLAGRTTGGVTVALEMAAYATTIDWHETALVAFERGFVQLELPAPLACRRPGRVTVFRDPGGGRTPTTTVPTLPWSHAMWEQAKHFVAAVRGRPTPLCTAAEGLKDLQVAEQYIDLLGRA